MQYIVATKDEQNICHSMIFVINMYKHKAYFIDSLKT